jgi:hypothetical protein
MFFVLVIPYIFATDHALALSSSKQINPTVCIMRDRQQQKKNKPGFHFATEGPLVFVSQTDYSASNMLKPSVDCLLTEFLLSGQIII